MLHLYAVTEHPAQLPAVRGIDDAALRTATSDGLDAVVSSIIQRDTALSQEAILAHARVVEEVAATNPAVLPARFGGAYPDDDAVAAAVRMRARELRLSLEEVRGSVEIGVRVVRTGPDQKVAAASGGEYMQARLARVREAEQLAASLAEAVNPVARAETHSVLATPELVVSAAFLVPRDAFDEVRAAVHRLGASQPQLSFLCTGPWPAYSFALVDKDRDEPS